MRCALGPVLVVKQLAKVETVSGPTRAGDAVTSWRDLRCFVYELLLIAQLDRSLSRDFNEL
jgi:hypothetical protein